MLYWGYEREDLGTIFSLSETRFKKNPTLSIYKVRTFI